jgi:hypothetical protein
MVALTLRNVVHGSQKTLQVVGMQQHISTHDWRMCVDTIRGLVEHTYGDTLEGRVPGARSLSVEEDALVDGHLQIGHLQILPLYRTTRRHRWAQAIAHAKHARHTRHTHDEVPARGRRTTSRAGR